jgi:GxxExxY protein
MSVDKEKVLFPELSYEIIGSAFNVFNKNGFGMPEKFYQRAFACELENRKIAHDKEKMIDLKYEEKPIGRYFLDFLVDNKIVVELKVRPRLGYTHISQVMSYLKSSGYKLAIIIYFTNDGVKYRRVINNL